MSKRLFLILISFGLASGIEALDVSDPTRPMHLKQLAKPSVAKKSVPLKLQSIYFGEEKRFVIINDKLLRVGESISSWRVTEIESNQVSLRKGKQTKTLAMTPEVVQVAN